MSQTSGENVSITDKHPMDGINHMNQSLLYNKPQDILYPFISFLLHATHLHWHAACAAQTRQKFELHHPTSQRFFCFPEDLDSEISHI